MSSSSGRQVPGPDTNYGISLTGQMPEAEIVRNALEVEPAPQRAEVEVEDRNFLIPL
jgi:hypothetical protein